jgi:hypothetical protein
VTFEELGQRLPNGFHDCKIRGISADFVAKSFRLEIDLLTGVPHTANSEGYRVGTLTLVTPYLFFVERPDPRYRFIPNGSAIHAVGNSVTRGQRPEVDPLLEVLPEGACCYRFFLYEWNSFLYLAAASVEFSWEDGKPFKPE